MYIIVAISLLFAAAVTAEERTLENFCPPGVLSTESNIYLQVHEGSCFRFVTYRMRDYNHASGDCRQDGGTLAMPKTQSLNDYLTEQWLNHYNIRSPVWIGLHDKVKETEFMWEDNSKLGWSNFDKGNGPKNNIFRRGVEDCVAIDPTKNGQWHDFQCKSNFVSVVTGSNPKKRYICQYTLDFADDKLDSDVQDGDQKDNGHRDKDQLDKDHLYKDQLNKDQQDKDQQHKDQLNKDQQDKDQQDKDQQDKDQQDKGRQDKDQQDKDMQDKDQQDKDQQDKDQQEKDQQDKDQQDKDQLNKDQQDKDQQHKDQLNKDQQYKDMIYNDQKYKDQQDKDQQDKDHQYKGQQDKGQQDKDQQDKDQQDKDQQDKGQQDKVQLDKDHQDKDQQNKDQQDKDQNDDQTLLHNDECPKFVCDADCGMNGYQRDDKDCQICKCN
ncbi:hypothetical protein RRG08_034844 [Elysia crispata]|uniref:C-type lectin domain-containing protein n=1 Tax=Elysia crispata TaxID=231223 RepID=A0AAE1AM05_9GAST|nr:hypothetical protein RRG08_034844 [Elysia crispata]